MQAKAEAQRASVTPGTVGNKVDGTSVSNKTNGASSKSQFTVPSKTNVV